MPVLALRFLERQGGAFAGNADQRPSRKPSEVERDSTADEVEALIYRGESALTRFANNAVHQNVAEEGYSVSVRTAFDGRTARATTNKFDDESLKRVVQASESLAKVQHPDADLLPMPGAGESPAATQARPSRHFAQTGGACFRIAR